MIRHEDGPPCVTPRIPRQSTIRIKVRRYLVTWGLGESEREFPTFTEALAQYIDQIAARGGAQIWNLELCDEASNGLTDLESEAIELANEMFCTEVAS